jgi:hypothetical protein
MTLFILFPKVECLDQSKIPISQLNLENTEKVKNIIMRDIIILLRSKYILLSL